MKFKLVVVALLIVGMVWAQEKKNVPMPVRRVPVYVGKSDVNGGNISKARLDELLPQGISSRDSAGRAYKVDGFLVTYGERNLYEDSVGNLMYVTDLLSEPCMGDTLSSFLLQQLRERSKAGDTLYIDQVKVISPEGMAEQGKAMRLVITK